MITLYTAHTRIFLLESNIRPHIIETRLGALKGIRKEARNEKYFLAYCGIPYAKPPVEELRFEVSYKLHTCLDDGTDYEIMPSPLL